MHYRGLGLTKIPFSVNSEIRTSGKVIYLRNYCADKEEFERMLQGRRYKELLLSFSAVENCSLIEQRSYEEICRTHLGKICLKVAWRSTWLLTSASIRLYRGALDGLSLVGYSVAASRVLEYIKVDSTDSKESRAWNSSNLYKMIMGKSGNKVDTKKMLICVLEIEWI